jgi:hypothetical protein
MIENILKAAGCGGWVKFFSKFRVFREACVGRSDLRLGKRERTGCGIRRFSV